MELSKCYCLFHCTVSFKEYEHTLNLLLEISKMFLGKDVTKIGYDNLKSDSHLS